MAGTPDDLITREWWLLAVVLAFVMETSGLTPSEAENLLLDYAWMGWFDDFQWHEAGAWVVYDSVSTTRGIRSREWGKRDLRLGTENCVEWIHSRIVHRFTSPAPTVSAREIHELLLPFGALPDGYTMHLVCLRGIDVISMLRHARLLTREQETALLRATGFLASVSLAQMTEGMEANGTEKMAVPSQQASTSSKAAPSSETPSPGAEVKPRSKVRTKVKAKAKVKARAKAEGINAKGNRGAERTYDHDAIQDLARERLKTEPDKHRSWFYEGIRNAGRDCRPRVRVPESDRTLGRIVDDLYDEAKKCAERKSLDSGSNSH
jgi:hypothetical protein